MTVNDRIRISEPFSIGIDRPQMAKPIRHSLDETVPFFRENAADILRCPLDFAMRGRRHERENQRFNSIRMRLSVRKRERRPPGKAQDCPLIDTAQFAWCFNVGDQMGGCVGAEIRSWITCGWSAAAGTALIEQHSIEKLRVKKPPLTHRTPCTGTTMQEERGLPSRIAAAFPVNPVSTANIEHATVVWLYVGKLLRHARDDPSARLVLANELLAEQDGRN